MRRVDEWGRLLEQLPPLTHGLRGRSRAAPRAAQRDPRRAQRHPAPVRRQAHADAGRRRVAVRGSLDALDDLEALLRGAPDPTGPGRTGRGRRRCGRARRRAERIGAAYSFEPTGRREAHHAESPCGDAASGPSRGALGGGARRRSSATNAGAGRGRHCRPRRHLGDGERHGSTGTAESPPRRRRWPPLRARAKRRNARRLRRLPRWRSRRARGRATKPKSSRRRRTTPRRCAPPPM